MSDNPEILTQTADQIPVTTHPADVPTIFADCLYHMTWSNGVARLSFVQNIAGLPGPDGIAFEGRHVVNIALPFESAKAAAEYMIASFGQSETTQ